MTQPTAITDHASLGKASPWVMRFAPLIAAGGAVLLFLVVVIGRNLRR